MKITAIILSIMLIAISLSGCRTVREIYSGSHWDNNSLFLLERNKSTAKDIAYSFGSPQKEIIGGEKGRIWVYYYEKSKHIFQGNDKIGVVEGEHNSLTLWFDKTGILTDFSYTFNKFENPDMKKWAEDIEKKMREQGEGQK